MKLSNKNNNKNSKKTLTILVILGLIVMIIAIGKKNKVTVVEKGLQYITFPLEKAINISGDRLQKITLRFKNISKLEDENNKLKEEIDELRYNNNIFKEHEKENIRLKKLLEAKGRHGQYPSEGANVIAKDPGNWYKVFVIDKGSKKGVNENDVILADGGLLGHVIESGPLSAKVLSIIDDRSSVSAKVQRTGDVGILKGDIELIEQGLCRLRVDIQSEIIKGDQIVTSHLGDIYPPGIIIGIVEEIVIAKNGLNQHAYVRPVVNFENIEQVLILNTNE